MVKIELVTHPRHLDVAVRLLGAAGAEDIAVTETCCNDGVGSGAPVRGLTPEYRVKVEAVAAVSTAERGASAIGRAVHAGALCGSTAVLLTPLLGVVCIRTWDWSEPALAPDAGAPPDLVAATSPVGSGAPRGDGAGRLAGR
uniref:Uncharacterized protein n=1 Tax=uncultured Armatimonadetes bacterium TaxID=157466 RepID=A0A6J4J4A0_9BACT|nr:hypothetical protein AVDCRST_MAG63-2761 [uncultured Armatimonadetes bacterium]